MKTLFDKKLLEKYADKNGFIRLSVLPSFNKIRSKLEDLQNWTPTKESKPNYPWKYKNSYIYRSFVDVYVDKIFKGCYGWIQLSVYKTNDYYHMDKSKYSDYRETILMYVSKLEFIQSMYTRYIRIYYTDVNCNFTSIDIKVNDIYNLAFRYCTEDEINVINKLVSIKGPEPNYERFLIKEEYKDNYDLYVKDAKKYGFDKKLWTDEMISLVAGNDTQIDRDGYVYGGRSVDVKFVNV